jgi:hypothetical protein
MNREQLAALRDAIDTVLTWPDSVRATVEGRGAGAGPYDRAAELKPRPRADASLEKLVFASALESAGEAPAADRASVRSLPQAEPHHTGDDRRP